MKKPFVSFLVIAGLLFNSSCNQDNNNNNNNNPESETTLVPTDADGAFYALKTYGEDPDGTTGTVYQAMAWFDTYTATKHAGTVTVNGESLVDSLSGYPIAWYNYYGSDLDFSTISTASWSVSGSSVVTSFNHTDNTNFPSATFTVPTSINTNNSYTVSLSNVSANNGIVVQITGANQQKVTKTLTGSTTSTTFSSQELKSVAPASSYPIAISATVINYTTATYNSKKYYFVKEYTVAKQSAAE